MSIRSFEHRRKLGSLSASAFAALLLLASAAPASAQVSREHNTGGDSGVGSSSSGSSSSGGSSSSRGSGGSSSGSSFGSGGGSTSSSWHGDRGGGGGRRGEGRGRGYGRGDRGGRGHGGGHHHGGHRRYGYRGGYYGWGGYYGGWGGWWPWWSPGYGTTVIVERDRYGYGYGGDGSGALDTDISPENAQIFVDGEYVGEADDYDGFPTFLWLPRGTYDVAFYLPGYQTIVRQYTVRPGVVIDVEDRMTPGESIPPEELMRPKSTERRDARIQRNIEQNAEVDRREAEAAERAADRDADRGDAEDQEVGRLVLSLYPPDAAIYLDGHFLGTADEIGRLSAGLVVEPGEHELEVVRPGYGTVRRTVEVPAGEKTEVKFDLNRN